jgi:acylphosphatase
VREVEAREWFVSGHVQGVGFRWFVEKQALRIGVSGWVQNLDDGRVHAYAIGTKDQLNRLAAALHAGPDRATVRGVEERKASVQQLSSFQSR